MRAVLISLALVSAACGVRRPGAAGLVVVAPSTASAEVKARADLVCDGRNDEAKLLESLTRGGRYPVMVDFNPAAQKRVEALGRHSVVWLAGDYYLDGTLAIPDAADLVIQAEGAYFHYRPATGDAVVLAGMNRCRYYLGTIETESPGAALCVRPAKTMPALMSKISFTGLVGHHQKGTGLAIDPSAQNVCTNSFEGTDVAGFDTGILVAPARDPDPNEPGSGKADTNWFWCSYIRMCNTCVREGGKGVDDSVWNINVDASIPNSVAVRTAGKHGKWYVIMGTYGGPTAQALILDPGAQENVIEVHPPVERYPFVDHSGNRTNVVLSARKMARDKR